MTSRNFALAGAALLVAGLFAPIVTLPFVGSINLFNNGSNEIAIILVLLAAGSAALAAKGRTADILWPGAAAAGILLYVFVRLQYGLSQMRANVADMLKDNPFAGIAKGALGTVQLQWGWLALAAGAGLLIYAALRARKETERSALGIADNAERGIAAVSLLLLLAGPGYALIANSGPGSPSAPVPASSPGAALPPPVASATDDAKSPTAEEAAYIAGKLRLYDLDAKYYDSLLDGRIPGVRFKIRNGGDRTLNRVTVRVVFQDAQGKPIAEEEYNPVLVSEYSFGDSNTPLRPNYIWQQESGKFYAAKNVPSEWKSGKATATITDIEFGSDE